MEIADRRLKLHEILCTALGSLNVYFQPPESKKMVYPCIVYERQYIGKDYADNLGYIKRTRYQVTVIDKNPDSEIIERVSALPYCRHERHFYSDNLNHDIFNLYY